jgi:hypothetical protein
MSKRTWAEVLNDQAAAREDREPRRTVGINFPNDLYSLVAEAARIRGMSYTSYVRRAALALAEADLGFDWATLMVEEPGIVADVESRSALAGKKMAGHGYGPWKIEALGKHFEED